MKSGIRFIFLKSVFMGILISLSTVAKTEENLTLSEFLKQIENTNPLIQATKLRAKASRYRIDPASTIDDPFIAGGLDEIPSDGSMGSVRKYQISQSIPFPGKLSLRSRIAEHAAHASESDAETARRQILTIATQTFYRAFYNQKTISLTETQRSLIESTMISTKARYLTGESIHHDWLLAKVELSVLEADLLRLRREQKALLASLNELRNEVPNKPISSLAFNFTDSESAELKTEEIENQPEFKSIGFLLSQAEDESKLAKKSYLPDFTFQLMAMQPTSEMEGEKANWGFMVGMNIPLYLWRKQSDLSEASSLNQESILWEQKDLRNRLNTEIIEAREQLKTARDIVKLYQSSIIPNTNIVSQNAKSGYAAKRLPLNSFIETLRVQKIQELEFIAAQIDVELAKVRMREFLSNPPLLRLAPSRPSLFGGGGAMTSMGSDSVNMGGGIKAPTPQSKKSTQPTQESGTGMGNM